MYIPHSILVDAKDWRDAMSRLKQFGDILFRRSGVRENLVYLDINTHIEERRRQNGPLEGYQTSKVG